MFTEQELNMINNWFCMLGDDWNEGMSPEEEQAHLDLQAKILKLMGY